MKTVTKTQTILSKEEAEFLDGANELLRKINCKGIDCPDCPFYIKGVKTLEFSCVINYLNDIYKTRIEK